MHINTEYDIGDKFFTIIDDKIVQKTVRRIFCEFTEGGFPIIKYYTETGSSAEYRTKNMFKTKFEAAQDWLYMNNIEVKVTMEDSYD